MAGPPRAAIARLPSSPPSLSSESTKHTCAPTSGWSNRRFAAESTASCYATPRSPEAIRAFVQACRYPNAKPVKGIGEGLLGSGSQGYASRIWGITAAEYTKKADPWPLNPGGEFLLGLKIEDKHALANADLVAAVPGIGFAEWGPGDMGISLNLPDGHTANETLHPEMRAARAKVLAACKKNKIAFLNTVRPDDVEKMIDEGVRIGSGGQEAAEKGRRYTKRPLPW